MLRKFELVPKQTQEKIRACFGGRSFNCRREGHPVGKVPDILCWRCKTRMGCSRCVESPRDRICLVCHEWATKIAYENHGPIEKEPVIARDAMKIVQMRKSGQITDQESEQLFSELWKLV
jgi:hypothetical protein